MFRDKYPAVDGFFTDQYVASNVHTDRVAVDYKINDAAPRSVNGLEIPQNHGIVFAGEGVRLPAEGLDRLLVSVTNYGDDTFLMRFETGNHWPKVSAAVCSGD